MAYNDLSDGSKSALANSGISAEDYDRETASQNGVAGLQDENKGAGVPQDVPGMESVPEPDMRLSGDGSYGDPTLDDMKRLSVMGMGDMLPQAVEGPTMPANRPEDPFSDKPSVVERPKDPFAESQASVPSAPVKTDGSEKPTDPNVMMIARANNTPVAATNGQTVDIAYEKAKAEDKQDNYAALDKAIKAGDQKQIDAILKGMTQEEQVGYVSYRDKKNYAFERGFVNTAASNPKVSDNNTPEKISSVAAREAANNEYEAIAQIIKETVGPLAIASEIAVTLAPGVYTYQGMSMASIMKDGMTEAWQKNMPKVQHRLDDIEYFRKYLSTLPEDQAAKEVRRVFDTIKDKHGAFLASLWYADFMSPDKEYFLNSGIRYETFVKGLDTVGIGLDAVFVGQLIKSPRVARALSRVFSVASNPRKALGIKAGKGSEFIKDSAEAIAKNRDGAASKLTEAVDDSLTGGVTRHAPNEPAINSGLLKEETYKALQRQADELDLRLFKGTITAEEHAENSSRILSDMQKLAASKNTMVHSARLADNGKDIIVLHKPAGRENWATKEGAEAFARNREDLVVVPDTANVHVGLSPEMRQNYDAIAKAQEQIIAQKMGIDAADLVAATENGRKAIQAEWKASLAARSPNALPEELSKAIPTVGVGSTRLPVRLSSDYDKAAWALSSTAVKDKAPWQAWAKQNGHSLDALDVRADELRAAAASKPASEWRQAGFVDLRETETAALGLREADLTSELSMPAGFPVNVDRSTSVAGFSKSIPSEVESLADDIVKRFGLDGDIAFLSIKDLTLSAEEMQLVNAAKASGRNSVHLVVDFFNASTYKSAIVVLDDSATAYTGSNRARMFQDIVASIGEAHIYSYTEKNSDAIRNMFNLHLNDLKIANVTEADFADLWRMSSGGVSHKMLDDAAKYGYDVKKYLAANPEVEKQLSSFRSWFGSNFSKYAFATAEPTTFLGQLFHSMGQAIKDVANFFLRTFGREVSNVEADRRVAEFLSKFERDVVTARPLDDWDATRVYLMKNSDDLRYADAVDAYVDAKRALAADAENADQLVTGWLVERKIDGTKVKYENINGYSLESVENIGRLSSKATSRFGAPMQMYQGNQSRLLKDTAVKSKLDKEIKNIENSLSAGQADALNEILVNGNKYAIEWTPDQIVTMLEKTGLSNKDVAGVIEAYGKQRFWENWLWKLNDTSQSNYLMSTGYFKIGMKGAGTPDINVIAKPLVGDNMFLSEVTLNRLKEKGERAWHVQEAKWVTIDDAFEAKYLSKSDGGYRSSLMIFDGHVAETVPSAGVDLGKAKLYISEANKTSLREIDSVVPYLPGSYRRYYTSPYFVEVKGSQLVNGVSQEIDWALHTAETRGAAEKFAKMLNDAAKMIKDNKSTDDVVKALEKQVADNDFRLDVDSFVKGLVAGEFGDAPVFSARFMNTNEDWIRTTRQGFEARMGARSRGVQELSPVEAGIKDGANMESPFEAMRKEAESLLTSGGEERWAAEQIHRTVATFRDVLPTETKNMSPIEVYNYFDKNGLKFVGPMNSQKAAAERAFKEIQRVLGSDTTEVATLKLWTRQFGEYLQDKGSAAGVFGKLIAGRDPISGLRGLTFHAMLGLGNIAQLPLQALSATIAFSMHPIHGLSAARKMTTMRFAMMSDDPDIWVRWAKADWAAMKSSRMGLGGKNLAEHIDDYVATVQSLQRSGLIQDVAGTSIYAGRGGFSKSVAGKASVAFFSEGERLNRMMSFLIARDEWIDAAKKAGTSTKWHDADNMRTILGRADDYMFNMTSANKSVLNEGVLSIPMQFKQYAVNVASSVIQSILGRGPFTRKDLAKMFIGVTTILGVPNVPFADKSELYVKKMVDAYFGEGTYEAMPENARVGVRSGLLGVFTNEAWGVETALSDRANWANVFSSFGDDIENKYNKSLLALFMGPSYTIVTNIKDFVAMVGGDWVNAGELSSQDIVKAVGQYSPVTSMRNSARAYLATNNMNVLKNKRGQDIIELSEQEVFAKAFGFGTMKELQYYERVDSEKEYKQNLKEIGEEIFNVEQDIQIAKSKGDAEWEDHLNKKLVVLYNGVKPADWNAVMKSLYNKRKQSYKGTAEEQLKMRELKRESRSFMNEVED